MSNEELVDAYEAAIEYGRIGWSHTGKWIGRTFALLTAWSVTYTILFFVAVIERVEWLIWVMPLPILVHLIAEPLFVKHEEKEFGSDE